MLRPAHERGTVKGRVTRTQWFMALPQESTFNAKRFSGALDSRLARVVNEQARGAASQNGGGSPCA